MGVSVLAMVSKEFSMAVQAWCHWFLTFVLGLPQLFCQKM